MLPRITEAMAPVLRFLGDPELNAMLEDPEVANFCLGNPQELPLPELVTALRAALVPRDKNWFAYKRSEPASRAAIAAAISPRLEVDFDPDDICVTNGGFGAIASALRAVAGPGDEVVFISPPWFFYEAMIIAAGAEPVRVRLAPPAFDLDVEAISAAITPRTVAVLVNTPHNPTGRVFESPELERLAAVLRAAGRGRDRPIYLLSDEPYHRIVFDGRRFTSPAACYEATLVLYSYGKTLLAPGMRMGYIAMPPTMPDRERLREDLGLAQMLTGWAYPNADLQYALPGLEPITIDVGAIQARRDRLVPSLRRLGYDISLPEGTFYAMGRSPLADDVAFEKVLRRHGVLVLPGTLVEVPGWFRVSLTANDGMVERGLDGFARALDEAAGR